MTLPWRAGTGGDRDAPVAHLSMVVGADQGGGGNCATLAGVVTRGVDPRRLSPLSRPSRPVGSGHRCRPRRGYLDAPRLSRAQVGRATALHKLWRVLECGGYQRGWSADAADASHWGTQRLALRDPLPPKLDSACRRQTRGWLCISNAARQQRGVDSCLATCR